MYSAERLEKACERVLHYNYISATLIKSILDRKLEDLEPDNQQGETCSIIPIHQNIRGAEAFI